MSEAVACSFCGHHFAGVAQLRVPSPTQKASTGEEVMLSPAEWLKENSRIIADVERNLTKDDYRIAPILGVIAAYITALESGRPVAGTSDSAPEVTFSCASCGVPVKVTRVKCSKCVGSMSNVLTCAFCGEQYPDGTPATKHERLTAHVKVCGSHPMREVEADRACMAADFARLVELVSSHSALEDGALTVVRFRTETWNQIKSLLTATRPSTTAPSEKARTEYSSP